MVVADDPAPPGGIEQGRTGSRVFEVEERGDLTVRANHYVDRGEVAVDERDAVERVPLPQIRGRPVAEVDAAYVDGPKPAGQAAHSIRQVASAIGIAEPARPRIAVDPGSKQPMSACRLEHGRGRNG